MTYRRAHLGFIFLLLLTLLVGFNLGLTFSQGQTGGRASWLTSFRSLRPTPSSAQLSNLQKIWQTIHSDYVDPTVDDTKLVDGALGGLVSGLGDPYSVYFSPSEAKAFQSEIDGTFEGIGMEIGYKSDALTVIAPLPNAPAAQAGLLAGDVILTIDGKSTTTMKLEEAVKAIRGRRGSKVTLQVHRGDEQSSRTFTIVRATITVDPVSSQVITVGPHHYGYIKINNFNDQTNTLFQRAVRSLLSQSVNGYILDLRNNPGGLLEQSIKVSSTFISSGPVVFEQYRSGQRKTLNVDGRAYVTDAPIAVLVNEGTASASEIVAGALQDNGRATIIGTTTFGKGSVQDYQQLAGGASLKITVAKWLTPRGRSITAQGITPDIVVETTADDRNHDRDPQLDRAKTWLETKK